MATITGHTSRASGTVLTATIYNNDHANHITNAQNLNNAKIESTIGTSVDGHAVVWDGIAGDAIKSANSAPLLVDNNLSDVDTAATAFDNIKQDATEGSAGVLEKATISEIRSAASGVKAICAEDIESASAIVTIVDGATLSIDWATFINAEGTIAGNRTIGNPTNGQPGTWRYLDIVQDATGGRTITFGNQYEFPGGTAPAASTAAGARDKFAIYCRTSTQFEVYQVGFDIK